jgi:hypothetical protein
MVVSIFNRRNLAGFLLAGGMLAVAGCQSGNPLSVLSGTSSTDPVPQQQAAEVRITVQELTAYCPAASIDAGRAISDSYARGGQDDPKKLLHRAAVSDVTRSCQYDGANVTITMALAGRVVPGPVATTGNVKLPLRVIVMQDTTEIVSRAYTHDVAISDTIGATQFVFSDTITIPTPSARNIRIYAGFEKPAAARR